MIAQRRFLCYDCNRDCSVPYGTPRPNNCPHCGSTNLHRHPDDQGARHRGGRGRGRGGGGRGGAMGGAGRGGGQGAGRGMYGPNQY